ncbi:MAG: PHP domain-containing protein, partial [Clostridia bacterium]|nr:PHP domain-containing protein [Clostridia bacterium]
MIMGKSARGEIVSMDTISAESGDIVVRGRVFAVDSRELPKHQAAVLSFCITDEHGSVHVSKFIRDKSPDREVVDKIKNGMYLTVGGEVAYNRYDDDIVLTPKFIQEAKAPPVRMDNASEKRVELHMHTRFSTQDALPDPAALIKRAAKWGHTAVAITDHGCAQAFPDAWHAAEKAGIKVIYGLEGYYINDVDERLAVTGYSELPLDAEFVAFDLECTGLYSDRDR